MNMSPVIDPKVVSAFWWLLLKWGVLVAIFLVAVVAIRWMLSALDETKDVFLSSSYMRHPIRAFKNSYRQRLVSTSKNRVALWWGLGIMWLIDGILQAQPAMPNNGFVQDVLAPALSGQPHWYIQILGWNIQFWSNHSIGADVFATLIQIGIGFFLLIGINHFIGRFALWLSIIWGVGIWFVGEGMGGLLTGNSTWLTGTPGSVLFYVGGAVLLLLPETWWRNGKMQNIARRSVGVFWLFAATLQALPGSGFWTRQGLVGIFSVEANMPQPRFFAYPIDVVITMVKIHPLLWNATFVLIMVVLGMAFLLNRLPVWVSILTGGWLLFSWWIGQDFGVMGGIGTDPNSAPILGLLIVVTWTYRVHRSQIKYAAASFSL